MAEVRLAEVAADPAGVAKSIVEGWAPRFERLLIHVDLDVLDYLHMPLAENNRRNHGLQFEQLMAALRIFLQAPNWVGLTITELNPDHTDETTLEAFCEALAEAIATVPRMQHDTLVNASSK